MLAATSENVIVVTRPAIYSNKNLISYDISSGNLSWQQDVKLPVLLTSDEGTLFIGENNQIVLLDGKSGALVDTFSLPSAGIVTSLYRINDTFYIHGSAGRFVTYETVEKTQTTSEQNFVTRPLLVEDNILFVIEADKLSAIELSTDLVLWQTEINEAISNPVFSENMIIFRTGHPIYTGSIYALDKLAGNILWEKRADVIGNIEVKNSRVFFLGVEGYLAVLDQTSGQEIARIDFSDGPFILPDPNREIGGFYVAADPKGETIFTSFGDSCQLYAIEMVH